VVARANASYSRQSGRLSRNDFEGNFAVIGNPPGIRERSDSLERVLHVLGAVNAKRAAEMLEHPRVGPFIDAMGSTRAHRAEREICEANDDF
jgi:hypothetical protein